MTKQIMCDVCGDKPAVIKLVAVDFEGTVLDTYRVCMDDKNGWEPATGKCTKPLTTR